MKQILIAFALALSIGALADDGAKPQPSPVKVTLPKDIDGQSHPDRVKFEECLADVKEYVSWGDEEEAKEATNLCELRTQHAKLKADFVAKLQKLVDDYADATNHGINRLVANAAKKTVSMLVSCMSANDNEGLCHNIACVKAPERDRMDCYQWAITNPAVSHWAGDNN